MSPSRVQKMKSDIDFDVIILGGSYAGLSAAMTLGRSLRRTLVIDHGRACNRVTPHSHNFLTHDGAVPGELASIAKDQVLRYPSVQWRHGVAKRAVKEQGHFRVELETGDAWTARKIVLAMGIRDELPEIDGFAACWGKTVLHCPYCHGYEFRGKKTGIIAPPGRAFHLASLIDNLTDRLTLFAREDTLSDEQKEKLRAHAITIEDQKIVAIDHQDGQVRGVVLADGRTLEFDVLYAVLPFTQSSDIPATLGCTLTNSGHVEVNAFQQTTVEGVFACGDCANMMRTLAHAVASGNFAGAMINHLMIQEDF